MFCETMNNESLKRNISTKIENSFNMTRIPEIYGLNPKPTSRDSKLDRIRIVSLKVVSFKCID